MARIKKSSDSYTAYAKGGTKMKKMAMGGMKLQVGGKLKPNVKLKKDYDPLEKQRMKDLMKEGPVYDTTKKKPVTTPPTKPVKKTPSKMKSGGPVKKKAMGGMRMMKKGGKISRKK